MRIIATIVLGFLVAVASLICLLSSMCAVNGSTSGGDRTGVAIIALISLGVAIGGVLLIAKINRKQ